MTISLKVQGLEALQEDLSRLAPDANAKVRAAVNEGALRVKASAIRSIETISFGRVYGRKVSFRKVTKKQAKAGRTRGTARSQAIHIASKPGDAPNKDQGGLTRNIRVSTGKGNIKKGYYATVRAITPYAQRLEYGQGNVAARPYMRPALEANAEIIRNLVIKAVRSAIGN